MGDSVEFAVQPDNLLSPTAAYWEFELYLPAGKTPYAASRRAPLPRTMVTDWRAAVAPTGERGNVRYQAAIPWADLGVADPRPGRTFSFALVLNDKDNAESSFTGGRPRIRWFKGIDTAKNPEGFGDVTLVQRRHYLVAFGHRQGATGAKVILHIDDDQRIGRSNRQRSHRFHHSLPVSRGGDYTPGGAEGVAPGNLPRPVGEGNPRLGGEASGLCKV